MAELMAKDGKPARCIYVAGRYRGMTRAAVALNIEAAKAVGVQMAERGWYPVIPHCNTAYFDDFCEQPEAFYLAGTLDLMRRCDAVVMVPGWRDSEGAKAERNQAYADGLLVFESPEDVPFCKYFVGQGAAND